MDVNFRPYPHQGPRSVTRSSSSFQTESHRLLHPSLSPALSRASKPHPGSNAMQKDRPLRTNSHKRSTRQHSGKMTLSGRWVIMQNGTAECRIEFPCYVMIMVAEVVFKHGKSNESKLFPLTNESRDNDIDLPHLLQIICTTFPFNNVKHRLSAEPAGPRRSDSLVRECCVFVIDFYSLVTSASSSGVRH